MEKVSQSRLKSIYFDVLNTYTKISNTPIGTVYSKHVSVFDSIETDKEQEKALEKAKSLGLPTNKEQTIYLEKEGLWSSAEESEIYELETMVNNLSDTKRSLFLKSQVVEIDKQIKSSEEKIHALKLKKSEMMGLTAETYAAKKANEIYMLKVLYKDKEFKERAMSEEDYDELSDEEMSKLLGSYNLGTKDLNIDNLKRISLCSFFVNFFYLAEDNPYIFYGVPIVKLTYYQSELFAFGRYFKHLASEAKSRPPTEMADDPDKLAEFYEMSKKAEEFMEKNDQRNKGGNENAGTTLVGATQEDLELLGMGKNEGDIDLMDYMQSKGGKPMELDDIMKLHS